MSYFNKISNPVLAGIIIGSVCTLILTQNRTYSVTSKMTVPPLVQSNIAEATATNVVRDIFTMDKDITTYSFSHLAEHFDTHEHYQDFYNSLKNSGYLAIFKSGHYMYAHVNRSEVLNQTFKDNQYYENVKVQYQEILDGQTKTNKTAYIRFKVNKNNTLSISRIVVG